MSILRVGLIHRRGRQVVALACCLVLGLYLALNVGISSAAAVFSFTNPNPITIPNSDQANPYPSNINVAGLSGNILKLTVTVTDLNHTCLDNVNLLLVGPTGQTVYLMGNTGGCPIDVPTDVTILFDDSGAPIPNDVNPLPSGTYQPTVLTGECQVSFPAPAPAAPYGTTLSGFNSTNPNGTWSLYVFSSCVGGTGSIASWTLNITVPSAGLSVTSAADPNPVKPGNDLTYTVVVNNGGPDPVTNAVLTLPITTGTTFQSLAPAAGWTCTTPPVNSGGTATCTIATLPVGSATFILVVRVNPSTPDGTLLVNTVTVSSATFDPNPGDNSATTSVLVRINQERNLADLVPQLRVTPDREFAITGDNRLAYTLIIKNKGEGLAHFVYAQLPLDPNLEPAYTEFSDPNIWVERIVTEVDKPYLQLRYPNFEPGKVMTATVFMRDKVGAVGGSEVFTRFKAFWDDDGGAGKNEGSNAVRLLLTPNSNRDDTGGQVQFFNIAPGQSNPDGSIQIRADFYAPNEPVSFWYTDKNGVSAGLGGGLADQEGRLTFTLHPANLPGNGSYAIAGFGERSEVIGSIGIALGSLPSSSGFSVEAKNQLEANKWLDTRRLLEIAKKFKAYKSR